MTRKKVSRALALVVLLSTGLVSAQSLPQAPDILTVGSGERLVLELETPLHTRVTKKGESVYFRTVDYLRAGDRVVIPKGSSVKGTVTKTKRAGRIKGRSELQLRLDEVRLAEGTALPLGASIVRAGLTSLNEGEGGDPKLKGESGSGGSTASVINGGLQGTIIGAVIGRGAGAIYGGAIGAGIGIAGIILRRGPDIDLPRGTLFEAKFDRSLDVPSAVAQRAAEMARAESPPQKSVRISDTEATSEIRIPERPRLSRRDKVGVEPPPETVKIDPPVASTTPPPPPAPPPPATDVEANPRAFKLSVDVPLVLVDAVVRDRLGRPMENLRKEDFRLLEDGVEQQVQSLSRDEYPLAVAIVIDRSGSVAPYMNEIRHAAYRALMKLKSGDQVCLYSFAARVERLEELTADRQRIADRIATIRAGGGTNIIDALHDATMYLSMVAPERRRAVILVSDNQATTQPRASEGETIRLAQETETVIYSVKTAGISPPITMRLPKMIGGGAGSVRKVTEETGGEIIDVTSSGSVDAALGAAVQRLKLRYTLGYYLPNPSAGSFRRIVVRLAERYGHSGNDYTVHSRTGYYTPAAKTTSARP